MKRVLQRYVHLSSFYKVEVKKSVPMLQDVESFAVSLIKSKNNWLVISGAGISTDSGIPDYRSPGRPQYNPITIQAFLSSNEVRKRYWARSFIGYRKMLDARPNAIHRALVRGQSLGTIGSIITQNVDGLHHAAGSEPNSVVELHGSIHSVKCNNCNSAYTRKHIQQKMTYFNPTFVKSLVLNDDSKHSMSSSFLEIKSRPDGDSEISETTLENFIIPSCDVCDGLLQPDIVFFGGNVPLKTSLIADKMVENCSGIIVLGSSLTVWSAYKFILRTIEQDLFGKNLLETDSDEILKYKILSSKRPIIIINDGVTRADDLTPIKINQRISPVLEKIF